MTSAMSCFRFVILSLALLSSVTIKAQVEKAVKAPTDILPHEPDSLNVLGDTTRSPNQSTETTPLQSEIKHAINYSARDSMIADQQTGLVTLYGEAVVSYDEFVVEAEQIVIDFKNNTITGVSITDSSGHRVGYPIFKNGQELYETKGIVYNFKTRRARVTEVVTAQNQGFLRSGTALKNDEGDILSLDNSYTTCDLEHPHFRIRAKRAKAIKDGNVVTGPFYVEFNDIPLPAGFLFGIFPGKQESTSGIIFPSYGEESARGFNIRGGGYFFDINEYIKVSLTGDLYTRGDHALYLNSNYAKRYAYSGSVNLAYSKTFISTDIENRSSVNDYRISWSHSPTVKGNSRFAASVNAATSTYTENNMLYFDNTNSSANALANISSSLSSNISYNKTFSGSPFSLGVNLSHSQNLITKEVSLLLPNLSLTMQNQYPFQKASKLKALHNLSIGYSMTANNQVSNNLGDVTGEGTDSIASFDINNLSAFFHQSRKGVRHSINLSNSLNVLNHFTVSPTMSYEEKWYFEKLDWVYDSAQNTFTSDTISEFNQIRNYSFGAGLTTKVYGMYLVRNRESRVKAIRHVVSPSLSFMYTPDFSNNERYFQKIAGEGGYTLKSRHEGFLYGTSNSDATAVIGMGLSNNLEMKVKSAKDTVERKVSLLNNLSFSTSYNLLADSFRLAPISIAANTNVFKDKVNINVSGTLDPYNYVSSTDEEGSKTERRLGYYSWKGGSLGRLTSATLSLNANLNPDKQKKDNATREAIGQSSLPAESKQYLLQRPGSYIDFEIPWSLNLGYYLTYNHALNSSPSLVQTIQASGDASISNKWKITYSAAYDIMNKALTQTTLGITRDLHCWTMNFNWIPFGNFQSYNFSIAIKASVLKDLKIQKRRSFTDN